jgi:hypothetical protein
MSLLFTLLVLTCAFVVDQVSTEEDKAVSYSGYQVWRITTLSKEEHQVVLKMIEHFGKQIIFNKYTQLNHDN